MLRLTATLAPLAERGIRVNCICPHTVATPAVLGTIAELQAKREELPPPLRDELIAPETIADGVIRLVRDESLARRVLLYRGAEEPRLLAPYRASLAGAGGAARRLGTCSLGDTGRAASESSGGAAAGRK